MWSRQSAATASDRKKLTAVRNPGECMTLAARRVVVTGLGAICPLGSSKEALWEGLSQGRSGVGLLSEEPNNGAPIRVGAPSRQFTGEIDDFGPLEKEAKKAIRKGLKVMCRECQMGVAVAQLALADAGLKPGTTDPERSGISFGADYMLSVPEEFSEGIVQCLDQQGRFQFSRWGMEGMTKMSPLWLLKYLPNMPASHLAIYNDFRGPNNSLTLREASANAALGEAYQIILRGDAELMLVGATGTRLHTMKILHAVEQEEVFLGDEPATASRPFDRDRSGMVLGEGAGAIVLEELATAQARGATIYGEVIGAATSSVAGPRLVARRDRAMANVLQSVLRSTGQKADDVGHLHAHGLSTRTSDADEARAIQEVFGGRATPLPVVAAKSYFGNLGAGSGLVELIASLLAMQHDQLFPILNYATPDPECPIAAVRNGDARPGPTFINLNVTPQGQASAAILRRFQ
jgi:3-oxoacyl-[acyl-carrier-protein] synthase II